MPSSLEAVFEPFRRNTVGIDARFENGVLHIHMPKQEEAKGRKISIRSEK